MIFLIISLFSFLSLFFIYNEVKLTIFYIYIKIKKWGVKKKKSDEEMGVGLDRLQKAYAITAQDPRSVALPVPQKGATDTPDFNSTSLSSMLTPLSARGNLDYENMVTR